MEFETIRRELEGIPYISPDRAKRLYDFIIETERTSCLELGFAHGTSTCYIAAALDELGTGTVTAVDLKDSADRSPNAEELLDRTGLGRFVHLVREENSYNWYLKRAIEESTVDGAPAPRFDFCFIDGAKNWTIDGLAFFLVDKLLMEDGWVLFDDFRWTYESHAGAKQSCDGVTIRELSEVERKTPHVEAIFRLLVMQHPSYGEFSVQDDTWAWAHKSAAATRTLKVEESVPFSALVAKGLRRGYWAMRSRLKR